MVIAKLVYLAHRGGDVYGAAAYCHRVEIKLALTNSNMRDII